MEPKRSSSGKREAKKADASPPNFESPDIDEKAPKIPRRTLSGSESCGAASKMAKCAQKENEAKSCAAKAGDYSDHSGERSEIESSLSSTTTSHELLVSMPRPHSDVEHLPGAYAVAGIDGSIATVDFTGAETIESEPQQQEPMEPITAEAVDVEADRREFNELLQRELERKLTEKDRKTQVAEVVDWQFCLCTRRARGLSIIGSILLVVAVALAISLTLTLRPDPPPDEPESLEDFLASVSFDGGIAIRTPLTPQNRALLWLENNTMLSNYTDAQKKQRYSLATLFYSTHGESWDKNSSWLLDDNECDTWHNGAADDGTVCTDDGALLRLALPSNKLNGTLPDEIALLSDSLEVLHLERNELHGFMPSTIGLLKELKSFYLYTNRVSGGIPSQVGLLTDLEELLLHSNDLSFHLPTTLGSLTNLEKLNLESNRLNGSLPSTIGLMTKLGELLVGGNLLSGTIPTVIGQLMMLRRLEVQHNQLSGKLPTFVGWLKRIEELWLENNTLSGTIPSEVAWTMSPAAGTLRTTGLARLRLSQNKFNSTIPTELGELSYLKQLFLWENELSGSVPSELGLLGVTMRDLEIYDNRLTGTIPEELFNLTKLTSLDVSSGDISGTLSTRVGNLDLMQRLRFSRNKLVGSIPSEIGKLSRLVLLWSHLNEFTGSVPEILCDYRPRPLRFLQADCFPVENATQPCMCCSHCCDRETRECDDSEG